MIKHFFKAAYLRGKWEHQVLLTIDPEGRIDNIQTDSAPGEAIQHSGYAVPGIPNVHSHAFQRAMAGLGEVAGPSDDSFWSWRKVMYKFLGQITPEDLQAIADQLYMEMLKAGFTSVGEFHYLHHQPDGQPFGDRIEMSRRLAASAAKTGIQMTLLPVLYRFSGFGSKEPTEGQRRFIQTTDDFLTMVSLLKSADFGSADVAVGMAPHSLRATDLEQLHALNVALTQDMPLHIHIAEQMKEVEDCLAWSGKRPVEWLMANVDVDQRWCLIHATHVTKDEVIAIAQSGASVGLCPITEANLGDGIFPINAFMEAGGQWGLGTDSNVNISLAEECRTLEYGQRLKHLKRTLIAKRGSSNGKELFDQALKGGSRALRPLEKAGLTEGAFANFVVLDGEHVALAGRDTSSMFDSWFFGCGNGLVKDVYVRGTKVVSDGHHVYEEGITKRFKTVMKRLAGNL
ncbi:MAG: formimidoylglutamate deiminase [Sneathiella sp.]|nr:formimidoylglutamate deiminase [Sneathiella sp.]